MRELINNLRCRTSCKFLTLLLLADLAFLIFHILYLSGVLKDPLLSIERETGYSEIYQYIKEFWIFILLLIIAVKEKRLIYFAWSILFLYLLVDDSFALHEKVGNYLTNYVDFKPVLNLKAADIGELCASAFFGILLFGTLFILYLFSKPIEKKISRELFILILALAFFGVFFDMLHAAIHWGENIWGIIEDGGEMVIISILLCYAYELKIEKID